MTGEEGEWGDGVGEGFQGLMGGVPIMRSPEPTDLTKPEVSRE